MAKQWQFISLLILLYALLFQSCSTIHSMDYVPAKAGKYPNFSECIKLLGTLTHFRSCFDVHFYSLDIKVDPDKQTVGGTVRISSSAVTDFDTLQLDLYKSMPVNSLTFEGKELKYERKEGAIFVFMPRKIQAGETFDLTVRYEGTPVVSKKAPWEGGFVWKKDKNGNPWDGVACESEGASLWWPCKDHNSDEADSVSIAVSVPKGLMAVCNGVLKDSADLGNGWEKFNWKTSYQVNNYDVTVYVGKFVLLHDTLVGINGKTLQLNHYVLPYDYDRAQKQFVQAKDVIHFYEKTFGEYPWYRDGYKLVESPFEGMEHQTAIAYGSSFKNFPFFGFDYIILHETAHEWWGNAISAADLSDVWLQEGFATYSEALYVEAKYGREKYYPYINVYRYEIENKRPMVGPTGVHYFDYHDEDVYTKGTNTLETLRSVINNDSLFFNILKTYFSRYKMHQITSQQFIDVVNEKTKADYTWFFNQYLHNRQIPVLEYTFAPDGQFSYQWTHCNNDFKMPIIVDCGTQKQVLKATTTLQQEYLCNNSPEKRFTLDADEKLYKIQAKTGK